MGVFTEHITISASKEAVWKMLADIGAIHEWNPGVTDSRTTTSGEIGLGSGRRCAPQLMHNVRRTKMSRWREVVAHVGPEMG